MILLKWYYEILEQLKSDLNDKKLEQDSLVKVSKCFFYNINIDLLNNFNFD